MNRIKEVLDTKIYTKEHILRTIGKSRPSLEYYVSGVIQNPPVSAIMKLAKLFSVSVEWLMGSEEKEYNHDYKTERELHEKELLERVQRM